MDQLNIIIQAILSSKSIEQIEQDLKLIESRLKPLELKIGDKSVKTLESLANASKGFKDEISSSTKGLNEQAKHIEAEKLQVDKLAGALKNVNKEMNELGKLTKTVKYLSSDREPHRQELLYQNKLKGLATTVYTDGKGSPTTYKEVQDNLVLEKEIAEVQKKNFQEAKQHLTEINKLRERYAKLGNKESEEVKEIAKQRTEHLAIYNNIIRKKSELSDGSKTESMSVEQILKLEQMREQTNKNIYRIKSQNVDKENIKQVKLDDGNIIKAQDENYKNIKHHLSEINKLEIERIKLGREDSDLTKEIDNQIKFHQSQYDKILNAKISMGKQTNIDAINEQQLNEVAKVNSQHQLNIAKQKEIQEKKITAEIERQAMAREKLLDTMYGMRGKSGAFIEGNNLIAFNELENRIKKLDPSDIGFAEKFKGAELELKKINTEMGIYKKQVTDASKFTGIFGQSLLEAGKKFAGWLFIGNIIMGVYRSIKAGVNIIKELDAEMIELKKVTDETNETYQKFMRSAIEVGNALGQSTQNVIRATAEWSRLGFTIKESLQLANESLMLANVGSMNVEQATQQLISTLHGFNMKASEAKIILDQMNEVGNNYAISTEGIGEALRRSSAAMAAGNNTLAETIALLSVANATVQNSEVVGTAFKTISMRIRGVTDEGEELEDMVPKMEAAFNSVGITMKKNEDTFKSTFEIMTDLRDIWDDLSDMKRAELLELVAGKRQGQVVAGLMQNAQDLEKVRDMALYSEGSAQREYLKYMEGIEYKTGVLQNKIVEFWTTMMDSSPISAFVITLTKLMEALAGISMAIGGLSGFSKLFVAAIVMWTLQTNRFGLAVRDVTTKNMMWGASINNLIAKLKFGAMAVDGFTISTRVLNAALMSIGVFAVISGITYLGTALYNVTKRAENAKKEFNDLTMTVSTLAKESSDLEELSDTYNELSNKISLTSEEKTKLTEVNNELANQFPELVTQYDAEGNAIKINTRLLEDYIALKNEELELKRLETASKFRSNYKDTEKDFLGDETSFKLTGLSEVDAIKDRIKNYNNALKEMREAGEKNTRIGGIFYTEEQLNKAISSSRTELSKALSKQKDAIFDYKSGIRAIIESSDIVDDLELSDIVNFTETIGGNIVELSRLAKNSDIDLTSLFKLEMDDADLLSFVRSISDIANEFDNLVDAQSGSTESIEKWAKSSRENIASVLSSQFGEEVSANIANIIFESLYGDNTLEIKFKIDRNSFLSELKNLTEEEVEVLVNIKFNEDNPEEYIKQINKALEELGVSVRILPMDDAIEELQKLIDDANIKDKDGLEINVKTKIDEGKYKDLIKYLQSQKIEIPAEILISTEGAKSLNDLINSFNNKEIRGTKLKTSLNQLSEIFKESSSVAKDLNAVLDELNKGEGLSASSIDKIIDKYNDFIPLLNDEKALREAIATQVESESDKIKQAYANAMMYSEDFYKNNQNAIQTMFKNLKDMYNIDINNWTSLAEAKEKIELQLISTLGKNWALYYDAISGTMTDYYRSMELADSGMGESIRDGLSKNTEYQSAKKLAGAMNEITSRFNNIAKIGFDSFNFDELGKSTSSSSSKYISDQYALALSELDKQMKVLEYNKSKMSKTSEEYRAITEKEIELSRQKQDLAHNEAERLRVLLQTVREGTKEYDDYTKTINDLGKAWLDLQGNIDSKSLDIANSKTDDLNNTATHTKDVLSRIKTELQYLIPYTSEYINKLQEQVTTTREYITTLTDLQRHYELVLASESLSLAQKDSYVDKLKQVKQELFNMQMELKSQLASQADEVISIYKSMYEQQKQIALNAIDDQLSAEEKRHKAVIDNLDSEIDKYEDLIKAKLKALERDADQESYEKKLSKAQKEAQDIQNKIDILSLDDSYEAMAKRQDLIEDLANKNEAIEEMQNKHNLDLRKNNLNDLLDAHKKQVNDKKKTEDKMFNMEKERLDKIKKETERYWNEQINDERKWMQVKQDIMNGNLNAVKDSFASFTSILNGNLEFLGNSIVNNLVDRMQQAKTAINSINAQMSSMPSGDSYDISNPYTPSGGGQKGLVQKGMLFTDAASIAGVNVVYDGATNTIKVGNLDTKFPPTGIGGTHLNAQDRLVIDNVDAVKELLKFAGGDVSRFHEGGIVDGSNPSNITELVNKLFNTNANEQIIKALKNELYVPEVNLGKFFKPNMSALINSLTPQVSLAGVGGGDTVYNMNVRIDKVENSEKGVEGLFKRINNEISKLGK